MHTLGPNQYKIFKKDPVYDILTDIICYIGGYQIFVTKICNVDRISYIKKMIPNISEQQTFHLLFIKEHEDSLLDKLCNYGILNH